MVKIAEIIFGILFLSVPLSKFHINNELNYILFSNINPINKPEFYNIFNFYGDFEKRITDSRIILYSISLFFFLLFMLKRIIFGGFNNNILLTISYALCIIFILENIIYTIISFLGTLFGIFSIVCYFDLIFIHDGLLIAKLFCLIILHFIIFCLVFALIIHSCKLSSMINIIRGQLKLLNENRDNTSINKLIFTYKGFDSKDYILEEKEMPGYPRNVFFSKKEVANNPQIKIKVGKKLNSLFPKTTIVIKSANTFIASEGQTYIETDGVPSLAKGGSGDVLAGMIAALLAQGYSATEAAITACQAHAKAAKKYGEDAFSLTPAKILSSL